MTAMSPNQQRAFLYGSLWAYLQPRLAQDAAIDYTAIPFDRITDKSNFTAVRPVIEKAVRRAAYGKLAQDADIQDLADLLNALSNGTNGEENFDQDMPPLSTEPGGAMPPGMMGGGGGGTRDAEPDDTVAKIKEFLKGQVPDNVLSQLDAFLAQSAGGGGGPPPPGGGGDNKLVIDQGEKSEEEEEKAEDDVPEMQPEILETNKGGGGGNDKRTAKDMKTAMDEAIRQERDNQRAIRAAERFVRPWVGEMAMDSATSPEDVYRAALKMRGVKGAEKLHADALRPVLEAQPKAGEQRGRGAGSSVLAHDATIAPTGGFFDRHPSLRGVRVQN